MILIFLEFSQPCIVNLWNNPHNPWQFVRAVILCGFGSYMFGWHVHEKAALLILLPLGFVFIFNFVIYDHELM